MKAISSIQKIKLYIISLWLFFVLVCILKIDIPIYFGPDWEIVNICYIIKTNIIPIVCLFFILLGLFFYLTFDYLLKGTGKLPFKIEKISNANYEHLAFLATYIIPLICFNFDNTRYIIVLFLVLIIIGAIYIKTNIYYANPTLALLGFRIYHIQMEQTKDEETIIVIAKQELSKNDKISTIPFDENIFYARKV